MDIKNNSITTVTTDDFVATITRVEEETHRIQVSRPHTPVPSLQIFELTPGELATMHAFLGQLIDLV